MIEPRLSRAVLDAAVDPAAVRTHLLTLTFSAPELEAAFKEEYQRESVRHIRFAVATGIFLVAIFGLLDHLLLSSVQQTLWLIRFGFICPVLLVTFAVTFLPDAYRYVEWVLAVTVFLAGAGILGLVLVSPPSLRYYDPGLILVLMYNFVFLKLRFVVATLLGWTLATLFFFAELFMHETPWPILVNNLFMWFSATVIGMFAAYFIETLARRNFVQERLVRRVREFGSYRLAALLGHGGMGEVWRAEHQLLARPAAIKLIRPEKLGPAEGEGAGEGRRGTLRRFEREAQATALLRSPHTIQLYDFGVSDAGVFYYVMELLDGFDLDSLVQRFGPVPWNRAVYLLQQVCDSLAEAHEHGLIHRDIKPANIYVCRYGRATDYVKVLDFGLVKSHREPDPAETAGATGRGEFLGTPSCMAPEQIAPDRPLDARTDIYGLGCAAYWLLTGRDVFTAPTAVQVLAHHLHTRPAPPSASSEQPIPAGLDAVILACLEKDPDLRPQTADVLARDLGRCTNGTPWTPDLAQAWWNEHAVPSQAQPWSGEARVVMPSMAGWRGRVSE